MLFLGPRSSLPPCAWRRHCFERRQETDKYSAPPEPERRNRRKRLLPRPSVRQVHRTLNSLLNGRSRMGSTFATLRGGLQKEDTARSSSRGGTSRWRERERLGTATASPLSSIRGQASAPTLIRRRPESSRSCQAHARSWRCLARGGKRGLRWRQCWRQCWRHCAACRLCLATAASQAAPAPGRRCRASTARHSLDKVTSRLCLVLHPDLGALPACGSPLTTRSIRSFRTESSLAARA
jgi:hypothetical protein